MATFLTSASGEGTNLSNSKAFEERGWMGICIDPFPTHMEGRTCQMFKEVVWSVPGHTVQFHTQQDLGGIAETSVNGRRRHQPRRSSSSPRPTLADILERAKAPADIAFMSLDIEGAELEALRGLPFDRYRFGATIEHTTKSPSAATS